MQRSINEQVRKNLQRVKSFSKNTKKLKSAIANARSAIHKNDYAFFIKALKGLNIPNFIFIFPAIKSDVRYLFRLKPIERLSLIKELEWQFTFLSDYLDELKEYLNFLRNLELCWVNDDFTEIDAELFKIEKTLGQSLRLIEIKVSLWSRLNREQQIQDYFEEIKLDNNLGGIMTGLIALIIERNEDEVYLPRFIYRMENFLRGVDFDLATLIRFVIGHSEPKTDDGWASVLSSTATGGIIDTYEAFLECCESKVSQIIKNNSKQLTNQDSTLLKQLLSYASIFNNLGDERYSQLVLKIQLSGLIECETSINLLESSYRSEFSEFIRCLCYEDELSSKINNFGFWNKFWISGKNLINKQENVEYEAYSLIKFSLNNLYLSRAAGLGYFAFRNEGINNFV